MYKYFFHFCIKKGCQCLCRFLNGIEVFGDRKTRLAKAQGKYQGRKPHAIPQDVAAEAARRLHDGESMARVASYLGVHRNTLAKMVRDGRVAA